MTTSCPLLRVVLDIRWKNWFDGVKELFIADLMGRISSVVIIITDI